MLTKLTGKNWSQPVTAKRWVPVALLLEKVKVATGYRFALLARASHRSWQRATGTA